ncbi:hydrogenase expression/formation protein HypE [Thalassobacillus hwangdonensis]|uniref:Hydrogenase expression/formation protein HypE n=1 Tax=Thalassobacillus hwangdonensis TaxID=546108 RepID=A0ABW3KWX8_9BACI
MKVLLSHGDGGRATHQLIKEVFQASFNDVELDKELDAAILDQQGGRMAITTDTFVIRPLFFPGGDIGKLAVTGTINDLAVSGARPAFITVGFILEEGLELDTLKQIVQSMARTAEEAGVRIVAGDTKVVEKGKCDQLYVNTTGIGFCNEYIKLSYQHIKQGDRVIINGGIAEHATSVLAERMDVPLSSNVSSDCRILNGIIDQLLTEFHTIRFMRDPTRGGIATTLKEIAEHAEIDIWLEEESIPILPEVRGTLELMGLEPYYMANEGKVLLIASEEESERIVDFLKAIPGQENASVIGHVSNGEGSVFLKTSTGGTRILDMLSGEPLPRIC